MIYFVTDSSTDVHPIEQQVVDLAPKYGLEIEVVPSGYKGFVGCGILVDAFDGADHYPIKSDKKWVTSTLHGIRTKQLL